MFKIFFDHNIIADTSEKRKKITGISIQCGYHCYISCSCDCGHKCKYRKNFYKLHNLSVKIHRFFEYKLHIKLPYLITIMKESNDMSGTTMCPFNKPRRHTCHDCKYCAGIDDNIDTICINKDMRDAWKEHRGKDTHIEDDTRANCIYFDPVEYANNYDKRTGSPIYDDDHYKKWTDIFKRNIKYKNEEGIK